MTRPRMPSADSPVRWRRGVGLVEMLISLAIAAALLTATAVALNASAQAYAINQEQASLMQQARVAMHRIVTSIRITHLHAPADAVLAADFADGFTVTGTAIGMIDKTGADIVYRYDADNHLILAVIDDVPHVLARGVERFTIRMEPMRSAESARTGGSWDLLKRATVTITVRTTPQTAQSSETTGVQTVTLSAAVAPRQNSW